MSKQGVLLINLGTPDECDPASVRRYLKQFLNDPRVIDLSAPMRWILANIIVIPFRYKKSAEAYRLIWQTDGSPLKVNSEKLSTALAASLGDKYQVDYAMRYGSPSISEVFKKYKDCETIRVIPLFPQYSSAATGSAVEELLGCIKNEWNIPSITLTKDFYNHPEFIASYANIISKHHQSTHFILFSYHGLPERQITKSHCIADCDHVNQCPSISDKNLFCYRAQCYETSRLLADRLQIEKSNYTVSFQSRLGRTPWIKPYTDLVLPELITKGIRNLSVVCPSFVADCLETLEEINIRAREQWRQLGGESFTFIPCLNDDALWVDSLKNMLMAKWLSLFIC